MVTFATVDDVAVKWRPLTPAEEAWAQTLIDEASALARRGVAGLDDLVATGAVDPVLARRVVTDAVLRVLRNPAGVSMHTVGSETYQMSGAGTVGRVVLTPDEIADLRPPAASGTDGVGVAGAYVGTVRIGRSPW